MTLEIIYWQTGIAMKDLVKAAGKKDQRCVMGPLVALVKFYDDNPDKLEELIRSCLN